MDGIFLASEITLKAEKGTELPRNFSGVAYSGGYIPRYNAVVDLATTKAAPDLSLLLQHDPSRIIGKITEVENTGQQLINAGELFSDDDEDAIKVAKKAKRGIRYQQSIGLYDANDEFVPQGKTVTVNGQEFTGPLVVLRDGLIREISIAALGADAKTSATFFSSNGAQDMDTAQLQAKVTELTGTLETTKNELATKTTELEAANERITTLSAELDGIKLEAKTAKVKGLFELMGKEFSDDAAKPYIAMSDEGIDAVTADYKSTRDNLPEHLFQAGDTQGDQDGQRKSGVLMAAVDNRFGKTETH